MVLSLRRFCLLDHRDPAHKNSLCSRGGRTKRREYGERERRKEMRKHRCTRCPDVLSWVLRQWILWNSDSLFFILEKIIAKCPSLITKLLHISLIPPCLFSFSLPSHFPFLPFFLPFFRCLWSHMIHMYSIIEKSPAFSNLFSQVKIPFHK